MPNVEVVQGREDELIAAFEAAGFRLKINRDPRGRPIYHVADEYGEAETLYDQKDVLEWLEAHGAVLDTDEDGNLALYPAEPAGSAQEFYERETGESWPPHRFNEVGEDLGVDQNAVRQWTAFAASQQKAAQPGVSTGAQPIFYTDPETGQQWFKSSETDQWQRGPGPQAAPGTPSLDAQINALVEKGDTEGAQRLFDFQNQMTEAQRVQAGVEARDQALRIAQSPGDWWTYMTRLADREGATVPFTVGTRGNQGYGGGLLSEPSYLGPQATAAPQPPVPSPAATAALPPPAFPEQPPFPGGQEVQPSWQPTPQALGQGIRRPFTEEELTPPPVAPGEVLSPLEAPTPRFMGQGRAIQTQAIGPGTIQQRDIKGNIVSAAPTAGGGDSFKLYAPEINAAYGGITQTQTPSQTTTPTGFQVPQRLATAFSGGQPGQARLLTALPGPGGSAPPFLSPQTLGQMLPSERAMYGAEVAAQGFSPEDYETQRRKQFGGFAGASAGGYGGGGIRGVRARSLGR